MKLALSQIAERLQLQWDGEDVSIARPSLVEDAGPGALALATSASYAAEAASRGAAALLAPPALATGLPVLRSERPRLDFARLLRLFNRRPAPAPGIHPSAVVSASADVAASASVGAGAVVEDGASVGERTVIGANAYVGHDARIGHDVALSPGAIVMDGSILGDRVRVQPGACIGSEGFGYEWDGARHVPVPHIGIVVVEDDVEIGANCAIDRAKTGETRIGRGAKIDNLVQIGHGVNIGPHCLVVSQAGISGSVTLEAGVVLAGQVGVSDNITIGAGAVVAAQSGVTHDLAGGKTYMGFPAREVGEARRITVAQARIPELLKRVQALEQSLPTPSVEGD